MNMILGRFGWLIENEKVDLENRYKREIGKRNFRRANWIWQREKNVKIEKNIF